MTLEGTYAFIGYGNMGSAILEGLVEAGALGGRHAVVYDPAPARREAAARVGAAIADSLPGAAAAGDVVLLCVKPQQIDEALRAAAPALARPVLLISIAAGVTIARIQGHLDARARVVRAMPNTPALARAGATGIALDGGCTDADANVALAIFRAVGMAEIVPEQHIDAVTALSGSGPAYFFAMVEHLVEAAVAEGLDRGVATRLAGQTLYGAGALLRASGEPAGVLRARVTSPGGTTEAALNQFAADGLGGAVRAAVGAAVARARELSGA